MAVIFLVLVGFIFGSVFFIVTALMDSLIVYFPLFKLWIVFNLAFIIQTVIAIVSKIKTKKFGKGNVIRSVIFGIIAFVLFVVFIVLIIINNFQAWRELYHAWF